MPHKYSQGGGSGLVGWIESALKAAAIMESAGDRRSGIAEACRTLGVGPEMIRRQLELLSYVTQHSPLEAIRSSQTKLEIFRSVERADPVRGAALRTDVLQDRLTVRQIQIELEEAKVRLGLREPLAITLDDVYRICLRDLPVLDRLRPPVNRSPQGDALWIGADLDWSTSTDGESESPYWCAMISNNIACTRVQKGSFFDFITRIGMAAWRYEVVSVVLASEQERKTLGSVLGWLEKRKGAPMFVVHVAGAAPMARQYKRAFADLGDAVAPVQTG